MYCQRCGTQLSREAGVCPSCGQATGTSHGLPAMRRPGIITLIAVLDFIATGMYGIASFLIVAMAAGSDDAAVGILFGVLLAVIATALALAGYGLIGLRNWGRLLQIGLSIVGLIAFPLGTIVSGLILYYLLRPGIRILFSGRPAGELTPDEIAAVHRIHGGTAAAVIAVVVALFLGIAVLGILAAIAIPNLMTAMERARQRRTMADMRTVSVLIDDFAVREQQLPEASSMTELARVVGVTQMPLVDAWGNPFEYVHDSESYWIASAGRDGVFEVDDPPWYEPAMTTSFDDDIVFYAGEFIRYPKGAQTPGE